MCFFNLFSYTEIRVSGYNSFARKREEDQSRVFSEDCAAHPTAAKDTASVLFFFVFFLHSFGENFHSIEMKVNSVTRLKLS